MSRDPLTLTVLGTPKPKGSRTIGRRKDGSVFTRPASRGEQAWTHAVAQAASCGSTGTLPPPYAVELTFRMPRPSRPAHPWPTRGDLDKLVRSTLDGLVHGGLLEDDRHVAELSASKLWASSTGGAGVVVTIGGVR